MVHAADGSMSGTTQELEQPEELLESIQRALQQHADNQRLIVGIAGAPASGKSTLAEWLVSRINATTPGQEPAVVVPMDGFHLDNRILDRHELRAVKGAPHTFDAVGFRSLLERLCAPLSAIDPSGKPFNEVELAGSIYIPVFDRAMDLARCAGNSVEPHHRIVVIEGNYLLLKRPVWCDIAQHLNLSVFLDVPEDILEQRLIQRWLDHGLDHEHAKERALSNDIPNAHVVTRESATAHLRFKSVRQ